MAARAELEATLQNRDLPTGCLFGGTSAKLLRAEGPGYGALVQANSPRAPHLLTHQHLGRTVLLPVGAHHPAVAIYEAEISRSDGRVARGFVELPDRPYFLEYRQACRNGVR